MASTDLISFTDQAARGKKKKIGEDGTPLEAVGLLFTSATSIYAGGVLQDVRAENDVLPEWSMMQGRPRI